MTEMHIPGNIAGRFTTPPLGILLHGTRSSRADNTISQEFYGTINYVRAGAGGLGWNATGGDGVYCVHITAGNWGHHAREHSSLYLSYEFAQPTVNHPITDGMVATFAAWFRKHVQPDHPHLVPATMPLPGHAEMPAGRRDGKSDPFPAGDGRNDDLRRRIRAALEVTVSDNDLMEAVYQQDRARLGAKRFAAHLDRPFYTGIVLICDGGVVTPAGTLPPAGPTDDLVTYWESAGVLRRY